MELVPPVMYAHPSSSITMPVPSSVPEPPMYVIYSRLTPSGSIFTTNASFSPPPKYGWTLPGASPFAEISPFLTS